MSQSTNEDIVTVPILAMDPEFDAADADLCIISSDNAQFKVHSSNLRAHSSVFPTVHGDANSVRDSARLAESGAVLRIILKFIYPEPPLPQLALLPFSTLEAVAVAADKYQFLVLSELCDCHMENHANTHPAEVLKYAFLRGADGMVARVAPHTISVEVFDAARTFDPILFQRWILYREACIAFIGGLIPFGGETFKEMESRLKEWMSHNNTASPPQFTISSSTEAWANTWGARVRGKVAVLLRR